MARKKPNRRADRKLFINCRVLMYLLLYVGLILGGCGNKNNHLVDQREDEALPVTILEAKPTIVPILAETVAQTEGAKETEIRPRVGGILVSRLYDEGKPVIAGQTLFQIDPVPFENALAEAKAQFLEQRVLVERTRREEYRMQQLVAENFVSERVYDGAVANHAAEKAALKTAKARVERAELNLSYTSVTAPVSGVSGRSQFSEGALVTANTSLLTTITQLSPIWVRFSFSNNELARFGGRLTEENIDYVTLILPDGSEYSEKGRINFAASNIDPLLGTQQLRATFKNAEHKILPGQFVRVRVAAFETRQVFILPQVAILTSDLGRYVYLLNEKGEAIQRVIEVGDWIGENWVVLKGLNAGDKVIIDNIIKLKPGLSVTPNSSVYP